jgi:hypothetical protein
MADLSDDQLQALLSSSSGNADNGLLASLLSKNPPAQPTLPQAPQSTQNGIPVPAPYVPGVSDRGPPAMVGYNPNNPGPNDNRIGPPVPSDLAARQAPDDEDEDEDDDKAVVTQKGVTSPGQTSQVSNPNKDYLGALMQKLGMGPDAQSRLESAQKQQTLLNGINSASMAGKEIGAAFANRYAPQFKPDYTVNKAAEAEAALPVQQEQQRRQATTDALNNGMKLSDLLDKQQLSDPDSAVSQAYRSMASSMSPSLAKSPNFDSMSAESIKAAQPMIDAGIRGQMMQMYKQQAMDQKADQRQQQAYNTTVQQLEQTSRSPDVRQAEVDLYNAQKAKSLSNLYGDPNKLSPQMTQLFTQEVAKIAQGGVPTHDEMKALTPNTLQGQLAGVYGKLMNDPTPANAGAFINQYQQYADEVSKNAQNAITNRYGRVINSKKSQFNDDQNQYLQDNYINRFKPTDNYTPSPGSHPQDKDMMNWAQQNINNPDPATKQAAMQVIQANMAGQK